MFHNHNTATLNQYLFQQDTISVAKHLLHYALVCIDPTSITGGHIVETEAYTANDPCSHSYKGKTKRNMAMFLSAGHIYVYHIYGIHFCVNIVTQREKVGEAVLIRSLKPLWGIQNMKKQRSQNNIKALCSGPGKLTHALSINMHYNTQYCPVFASIYQAKQYAVNISSTVLCLILLDTKLYSYDSSYSIKTDAFSFIGSSTRIGIHEKTPCLHRFYYRNNIYVSQKK